MRLTILSAVIALAAALAACGPAPTQNADAACPDGGARLPETGICVARAVAYLDVADGAPTPELPANCEWVVNEAMLAGEALLYRAARCGNVTTKLTASAGAHAAEVTWETSAFGGDAMRGRKAITLFTSSAQDPQFNIRDTMSDLPAAERATCEIRAAGIEGWPTDALLIAPTAATRARMPRNEPIAACGPYGVNEDETRYWRIKQGYAWFYELGQEAVDFDPGSVTVLTRQADGSWAAKS